MKMGPPPLRFLAIVIGGWIGARAALLGLGWRTEQPPALPADRPSLMAQRYPRLAYAALPDEVTGEVVGLRVATSLPVFRFLRAEAAYSGPRLAYELAEDFALAFAAAPGPAFTAGAPIGGFVAGAPAAATAGRWFGSAWLFLRGEGQRTLAPGSTLGGSQAGLRLAYRLDPSWSLGGRLYAPLDDLDGSEAAAGIEWQPSSRLPLHLLAERRQKIGRDGRSAFSLFAYGGMSDEPVAGPIVADAYAQAGVVGARSPDLFADGSLRLSAVPARGVKLGAGMWGAAQPGIERLDVGPTASVRITPKAALQADWRFRIAGDAAPGSGPSVTLGTDF